MKVLKIELNDGTFIYTDNVGIDDFRELMKRTKGAKEVTELEMTQEEYSAIPATNSAYEKYFNHNPANDRQQGKALINSKGEYNV